MRTYKLKLDIKYLDDVKSGKKNFEIRKNDREFKVGDILELKAYVKGLKAFAKWGEIIDPFNNFRMSHNYMTCAEEDADTIKVKILRVIYPKQINYDLTHWVSLSSSFGKINLDDVRKVLKEYFNRKTLPKDYAVLEIEVVK